MYFSVHMRANRYFSHIIGKIVCRLRPCSIENLSAPVHHVWVLNIFNLTASSFDRDTHHKIVDVFFNKLKLRVVVGVTYIYIYIYTACSRWTNRKTNTPYTGSGKDCGYTTIRVCGKAWRRRPRSGAFSYWTRGSRALRTSASTNGGRYFYTILLYINLLTGPGFKVVGAPGPNPVDSIRIIRFFNCDTGIKRRGSRGSLRLNDGTRPPLNPAPVYLYFTISCKSLFNPGNNYRGCLAVCLTFIASNLVADFSWSV